MEKRLNTECLRAAMEQARFSQTALADSLSVSRETVSKWLAGAKFPRPDKLLRVALLLELGVDNLVIRDGDRYEPVVAFRKRGASKTTERHINHAKEMGRYLRALVPYLPFNLLTRPATLKEPSTGYSYIQKVAAQIRSEVGAGATDELDYQHLIRKFGELQAVVVPVLWGRKEKHENALHIHLPDSLTTWIYLNLDVEIHDFKFWMAHELGHVYAQDLRDSEAEDFADALAGALIFPEPIAANAYDDVRSARTPGGQIKRLKSQALCYAISPVTVYLEINKYADHRGLPAIKLPNNSLYGANSNFYKQFHTVSETLFGDQRPDARHYIQTSEGVFQTPFFGVMRAFLAETGKSAGFIQSILDTSLLDAKGIHAELT